MASRGHLGGLSWTTPQALRVLDAAGCDVILVETVGVGQSEVEVAGLADTTVVLLAPGMGDGIQAAKAGILEIGDVFVVNKADRDGADATVARPAAHDLPRRPHRARPVAAAGRENRCGAKVGIDEVMEALDKHRAFIEANGELLRRRERRARDEIESIALAALRSRLGRLGDGRSWRAWPLESLAGSLDPYAAADVLLADVGSRPRHRDSPSTD